jgi:hypothetical protein
MLAFGPRTPFSNGQSIFQKGEQGSSMMAVLQGQAKIGICSPARLARFLLRMAESGGGILRGVTGLGLPLFYQLPPEPLVPACRNGHSEQIPPSPSSSPP